MQKLRICFAGTPAFSAAHLQALIHSHHELVAVYTQPDRPAGRGKKLQASPVKELALENGLPVYQPNSLKQVEEALTLAALNVDLMIVVAYGLILPKSILEVPAFGCLNVHASLLPRWRGAAPIERALLAGDKESGVTIMQMDEGLDTGVMLDSESVEILESDTRDDLENKLQIAGQEALLRTLSDLATFQKNATPQVDADSTYAAKLDKSEALIDWTMSASSVGRTVRAGVGRTPAYSVLDDQRLRVLAGQAINDLQAGPAGQIAASDKASFTVSCGQGAYRVENVQLPGKKPSSVKDINNSRPDYFAVGKVFASVQAPVQ